jgi:DNA-binding phage protein
MTLIAQLRQHREAQGRTLREVARTAKISERTLYSAEDRGVCNTATLEPWAAALGLKLVFMPIDAEISSSVEA